MSETEAKQSAAKCSVGMRDGKACGREVHDQDGYCICHSADSGKDTGTIQREVGGMLDRRDYDFTGFVFPYEVQFDDARFEADTSFRGATFRDAANFRQATFQGAADFRETKFQKNADFLRANFQDTASFRKTTFQSTAMFTLATFQNTADFSWATFRDEALLGGATFQKAATFTLAQFHGFADFLWAKFQDEAVFKGDSSDRVFDPESKDRFRYGRVFSPASDARFSDVRFDHPEKVVFRQVFLGRTSFVGTDVRRLDFTDVRWARRLGGRCAVWDELATVGGKMRGWWHPHMKDYALIGQLYRQLKHNYEERRDPITAGDFHFGEMHMRRLGNPPGNCVLCFLKRNLSFLALYRWISGYGEDHLLALAWVVGVTVAFALAFAYVPALTLQPSHSSAASPPMQGFWPRLSYSVMCFLLRPDRPLQPVYPAGHYVSVAEGVVGPPLLALLVLALNRRFKR